jgi:hypothetical protein
MPRFYEDLYDDVPDVTLPERPEARRPVDRLYIEERADALYRREHRQRIKQEKGREELNRYKKEFRWR